MSDVLVSRSGKAEITRAYEGKTAAIICPGPSLNQKDLELLKAVPCIAVNDAYLVAPWADVLYAADVRWWKWQEEGRPKKFPWASFNRDQVRSAIAGFGGQKVTINHPEVYRSPQVFILDNDGQHGLSESPYAIRTGQNSGYQALNIAVLAGAKRILLVGFDMRYINGRSHAHQGHQIALSEVTYKTYAKNFSTTETQLKKLGVEVINCTPGSTIKCYPFSTVECALTA